MNSDLVPLSFQPAFGFSPWEPQDPLCFNFSGYPSLLARWLPPPHKKEDNKKQKFPSDRQKERTPQVKNLSAFCSAHRRTASTGLSGPTPRPTSPPCPPLRATRVPEPRKTPERKSVFRAREPREALNVSDGSGCV